MEAIELFSDVFIDIADTAETLKKADPSGKKIEVLPGGQPLQPDVAGDVHQPLRTFRDAPR
jgi:hypothetical protein